MGRRHRPRLGVFKFASCDGCQLSLLDLEDELLAIAGAVEIAYFPEASSRTWEGQFDVALIDGSITTAHDAARILEIRARTHLLVSLGACATAGGIQALKNFKDVEAFRSAVYAKPEYIETLATSTPIADHVPVDLELRGCPPNKMQLLEVLSALLNGRKPAVAAHSVCIECKLRGNVCVMVTGTPCLGPVTHAGCGALCPAYHRGCYGCFGPMEAANTSALAAAWQAAGSSRLDILRGFRTFTGNAPAFRRESEAQQRALDEEEVR